MSFRITPARITAIIALALKHIDDRASSVVAPAAPTSNLRRLERAAAKARAHFSDGHRKGIIAIIAELIDVTDEERATVLASGSGESGDVLPWNMGEMIVPIGTQFGSHTYPLNEPAIGYTTDLLLKLGDYELVTGNHMARGKEHWRFATREEVIAFGEKLTAAMDAKASKDLAADDTLLIKLGIVAPKA